jgi:2-methylisocitrate lyase-like PEP mutase family enzyme
MADFSARRAAFRDLHREGCFVIPNPWDAGGAKRLEALGFKALASSSAAAAWTLGRNDGAITLDEALAHLRMLSAATDLPVNADFENGFADDPEGVAANVVAAAETGIAAVSVEDRPAGAPLYGFDHAVARVKAARAALDRAAGDVLLVARTEGFLAGAPDLAETIRRLKAFADAGADCVYAPGIGPLDANAEVVRAVAPTPVNVLLSTTPASVSELAAIGVRRVSVGGALAIRALDAFDEAAKMLKAEGRLPPRRKPA